MNAKNPISVVDTPGYKKAAKTGNAFDVGAAAQKYVPRTSVFNNTNQAGNSMLGAMGGNAGVDYALNNSLVGTNQFELDANGMVDPRLAQTPQPQQPTSVFNNGGKLLDGTQAGVTPPPGLSGSALEEYYKAAAAEKNAAAEKMNSFDTLGWANAGLGALTTGLAVYDYFGDGKDMREEQLGALQDNREYARSAFDDRNAFRAGASGGFDRNAAVV